MDHIKELQRIHAWYEHGLWTIRTEDNAYLSQLVLKTTCSHDNSYPRHLAPRTTRNQDNSYPGQVLSKATRTFTVGQIKTKEAVPMWFWPLAHNTHFYLHCQPNEWNHPTSETAVPHSWRNSMSISIEAYWQYIKDLSWLSDKFLWLIITFVQFWWALFRGSTDFPNCSKGIVSHLCWSHSVLSCSCMQITVFNQSGNYAK